MLSVRMGWSMKYTDLSDSYILNDPDSVPIPALEMLYD